MRDRDDRPLPAASRGQPRAALPFRVLPLKRFPALSKLPGHNPAHEAKCAPEGRNIEERMLPYFFRSSGVSVRRPSISYTLMMA